MGGGLLYSEQGAGCSATVQVPNVPTHPSMASVPVTILLYNGLWLGVKCTKYCYCYNNFKRASKMQSSSLKVVLNYNISRLYTFESASLHHSTIHSSM